MEEYRAIGIPDILTDTDAHGGITYLEDRAPVTRLEVAKLVEHAVVWQVHLVVGRDDLPILGNGGSIEDVILPIDEPDDGRDVVRSTDDCFES